MSWSHFGLLGCMVKGDAALIRFAPEPGIAQSGRHDEVHTPAKQLRERLLKLAKPREPRSEIITRREFDDEIEIAAAGVEVARASGAKEIELANAKALTEFDESRSLFFDRRNHAIQLKIDICAVRSSQAGLLHRTPLNSNIKFDVLRKAKGKRKN